MSKEDEFVTIARIVRPQGRQGEVIAEILTDFPERFADRKHLFLSSGNITTKRREAILEGSWFHKGRVVLKFAGVNSITEAEKLNGCEVQIPAVERAELEAGAFYISDLVGCAVWDEASRPAREIGTVASVEFGASSAPLLNVRRGQEEFQVPFAQDYIRRVDIKAKRLEMLLPEGLLAINQPLSEEEKEFLRRKQRDEV